MGVRFPSVQSSTLLNGNVGINIETTLAVTGFLILPLDSAVVLLMWYCVHTIGTTAVTTAAKVRRGSSGAGVLIAGGTPVTGTAGNVVVLSGCFIDTPGAAGPVQYTLGCIDPGSTVAGAVAEACIMAFAL